MDLRERGRSNCRWLNGCPGQFEDDAAFSMTPSDGSPAVGMGDGLDQEEAEPVPGAAEETIEVVRFKASREHPLLDGLRFHGHGYADFQSLSILAYFQDGGASFVLQRSGELAQVPECYPCEFSIPCNLSFFQMVQVAEFDLSTTFYIDGVAQDVGDGEGFDPARRGARHGQKPDLFHGDGHVGETILDAPDFGQNALRTAIIFHQASEQLDMTADEHEWIVDFVREAPCQFDEVFGAGFRCGLDGCGEGRVQLCGVVVLGQNLASASAGQWSECDLLLRWADQDEGHGWQESIQQAQGAGDFVGAIIATEKQDLRPEPAKFLYILIEVAKLVDLELLRKLRQVADQSAGLIGDDGYPGHSGHDLCEAVKSLLI